MFHASLYFYGKYRPLNVEADTAGGAIAALYRAAGEDTPTDVMERLKALWLMYLANKDRKRAYASMSTSHGTVGAMVKEGERDRWLDPVVADLPTCPGLTY